MPNRAALIQEIETVPEPLLDEVMDFIQFVKAKSIREGSIRLLPVSLH